MKTFNLILAVGLLAGVAGAQELTWPQLVQHPELWPAQCHLKHGFDFQSGAKVNAGDTVDVLEIHAQQVEVSTTTGKGFAFDVKPEDTDVLEAARTAYAKLTPRQRELTYAKIFQDQTLWPYRLTLKDTLDLGHGRRLHKGDQVVFRGVKGRRLEVAIIKLGTAYDAEPQVTVFEVNPQETDLMEQARKFVELPGHAPSRLIAQLQPFLINSTTAQPDPLNTNTPPRYLAFIRAAHFCPMSQRFLPKLAKFYQEMKPKHPDFEVIYLSCDQQVPAMEKFAQDTGFSWPTVPYKQTSYLYIVRPHLQSLMPQFTVMDPRGQVLISGVGEAENGVVQATSSDGNGNQPVANGISAAAALDQFAALLAKTPAGN
jgi:hypothetical protein